jgi:hypothetical protein
MAGKSFSIDVAAIRTRARQKADQVPAAERITQVGGEPDFNPVTPTDASPLPAQAFPVRPPARWGANAAQPCFPER